MQHAVQKRRCLGAGEVAFRTEHRFAASFHPAIAVSLADRILGPVAGNVGERRVGRLGSLVKARDHRGEFRARDGCVRTERAVGIAADDTHLRERGHRRGVPRSIRHIAVSVVLRQILHAHIVLEQAEEHGRHLGAADASVRAHGAVLIAHEISVVIVTVQDLRDRRQGDCILLGFGGLCRCHRNAGKSCRVGTAVPDAAVFHRHIGQLSGQQRSVFTVPAVKGAAALRLRGRTAGLFTARCQDILRCKAHRAKRLIGAHIAERDRILFPHGIERRFLCSLWERLFKKQACLIAVICLLRGSILRPAHKAVTIACKSAFRQRLRVAVREGLVLHRTRATVDIVVQGIALGVEPGNISRSLVAPVYLPRYKTQFFRHLLIRRVIPAVKHAACVRRRRCTEQRSRLGIRAFGNARSLHRRILAVQRNLAQLLRVGRIGDRYIGKRFPQRIKRNGCFIFYRLSLIRHNALKQCAVAICHRTVLVLCPARKAVALTRKGVFIQVSCRFLVPLRRAEGLIFHFPAAAVGVELNRKRIRRKLCNITHDAALLSNVQIGSRHHQISVRPCRFSVFFHPAGEVEPGGCLCLRSHSIACNSRLALIHIKGSAVLGHRSPARVVDRKFHRDLRQRLINGIQLHLLPILRHPERFLVHTVARLLRLLRIGRQSPTGEIGSLRHLHIIRQRLQRDRHAKRNTALCCITAALFLKRGIVIACMPFRCRAAAAIQIIHHRVGLWGKRPLAGERQVAAGHGKLPARCNGPTRRVAALPAVKMPCALQRLAIVHKEAAICIGRTLRGSDSFRAVMHFYLRRLGKAARRPAVFPGRLISQLILHIGHKCPAAIQHAVCRHVDQLRQADHIAVLSVAPAAEYPFARHIAIPVHAARSLHRRLFGDIHLRNGVCAAVDHGTFFRQFHVWIWTGRRIP